jgi:hypothetical protein
MSDNAPETPVIDTCGDCQWIGIKRMNRGHNECGAPAMSECGYCRKGAFGGAIAEMIGASITVYVGMVHCKTPACPAFARMAK